MDELKKHSITSISKLILRILIGLFFITTAVMKLLSLDSFEIYIYSFNLFSFNWCAILARFVIVGELLLGTFLIAKILYKPTWWLTMLMLVGFTLFLIYVAIFREDTNCHCMGDIVKLNPVYSIIKNVITMLLLLLVRKEEDYHFRGKVVVGIVALIAALVVPFALFPTDSVYNLFMKSDNKVNEKMFAEQMQDSTAQALNLSNGNYILGYLSADCKFCKISARKLNTIIENNHLDTNRVVFYIWGAEESVQKFKEETEAIHFRYIPIGPIHAIQLVEGNFPTYVFVQDGKPMEAVDIRGLGDTKIKDFLSK